MVFDIIARNLVQSTLREVSGLPCGDEHGFPRMWYSELWLYGARFLPEWGLVVGQMVVL